MCQKLVKTSSYVIICASAPVLIIANCSGLASRAELGKYFCLFFGRNENNVFCIRDLCLLTLNTNRSCGLMDKVSDF